MLQSLAGNSCGRLIQTHKSTWYFASLVLGYFLYLVFGAIVFSSVELPYEDLLRQELRAVKRQFLQENECLSEERLERLLKKALEASSYGVSILNNASVNWNWDFTSALFFASTVLSTTGERGPASTRVRWAPLGCVRAFRPLFFCFCFCRTYCMAPVRRPRKPLLRSVWHICHLECENCCTRDTFDTLSLFCPRP